MILRHGKRSPRGSHSCRNMEKNRATLCLGTLGIWPRDRMWISPKLCRAGMCNIPCSSLGFSQKDTRPQFVFRVPPRLLCMLHKSRISTVKQPQPSLMLLPLMRRWRRRRCWSGCRLWNHASIGICLWHRRRWSNLWAGCSRLAKFDLQGAVGDDDRHVPSAHRCQCVVRCCTCRNKVELLRS